MFVVAPLATEYNPDTSEHNTFFSIVFERNEGNKKYTTAPLFDLPTRESAQVVADALNKVMVKK